MDSLIDFPGVRVERKELRELTDFELQEVRWAFYELKRSPPVWTADELEVIKKEKRMRKVATSTFTNKFAELAFCHTRHCHHGDASFLAWHRRFVALFEQALRRVYVDSYLKAPPTNAPANYKPREMALPYWNYVAPDAVGAALDLPQVFADKLVDTGRPAGSKIRNPLYHAARAPTRLGAYLNDECKKHIDEVMGKPTYRAFQATLDSRPHGRIHVRTGGDMRNVATAAFDPVFWFHHSNIDRLWAEWHANHPEAGPSGKDVDVWLEKADVHWRGLLSYPQFPLYPGDTDRRNEVLRAEVLTGTPGVTYTIPGDGTAAPCPRAGVTRFNVKLEHVAQITGSYELTVLALGPGDAMPTTHDQIRSGAFDSKALTVAGVFADWECDCSPEELSIKVDVPLELDVTDRIHAVMGDDTPKPSEWNGGVQLPNGYRVIIVATPGESGPKARDQGDTTPGDAEAKATTEGGATPREAGNDEGNTTSSDTTPSGAGAKATDKGDTASSEAGTKTQEGDATPGDAGGSGDSCCATLPITAVKLKQGMVKAFPWQPVFSVRRSDDDVVRHGLYRQFLPQLNATEAGDGADETKDAANLPVSAGLAVVDEWTPDILHAMFRTRGAGVRIGVVDTGVDLTHDDLDNLRVSYLNPTASRLHWKDFSGDDAWAPRDWLGHGTLTAAILAGDSDGIAPDATLFMARAFGGNRDGSWEAVAQSIRWLIKSSVHIIVLPLGSYSHHRGVARAIYKAIADDIVVVAASGMDVQDDYQLHFDNADAATKGAMFPANLPGVISVAAAADARYCAYNAPRNTVTTKSVLLGYQRGQRGSSIDVVAPGIVSVGLIGDVRVAAGSSVATAHAAAVIALTLAAANTFHHSYDDRDVRAIAGAHEWLRFAGLAHAVRVPDKLLSPKMVVNSMIKHGRLMPPPTDPGVDLEVANLLFAMQRLGFGEAGEWRLRRAAPATGAGGGLGGLAGAGGETPGIMSRAPQLGEFVSAHKEAWVHGQGGTATPMSALKTAVSLAGMVRLVPSGGTAKELLDAMAAALTSPTKHLDLESLNSMARLPGGPVAASRVLLALAHINKEVAGAGNVVVSDVTVTVQTSFGDGRVVRSTLMQLVEARQET